MFNHLCVATPTLFYKLVEKFIRNTFKGCGISFVRILNHIFELLAGIQFWIDDFVQSVLVSIKQITQFRVYDSLDDLTVLELGQRRHQKACHDITCFPFMVYGKTNCIFATNIFLFGSMVK